METSDKKHLIIFFWRCVPMSYINDFIVIREYRQTNTLLFVTIVKSGLTFNYFVIDFSENL